MIFFRGGGGGGGGGYWTPSPLLDPCMVLLEYRQSQISIEMKLHKHPYLPHVQLVSFSSSILLKFFICDYIDLDETYTSLISIHLLGRYSIALNHNAIENLINL